MKIFLNQQCENVSESGIESEPSLRYAEWDEGVMRLMRERACQIIVPR